MAMDLFPRTITVPLLSFVMAFLFNYWLIHSKYKWGLDHPNARSLHEVPIPRIGGVGLFLGVITSWLLFSLAIPMMVLVGMGLLIAVSLVDDIRGLSVWFRLLVHGLVALGCACYLFLSEEGFFTAIMVTAAIIWMINLYNFMDGSDGLAGGMAVIGFGAYGLIAHLGGYENYALINFSIAFAALGFLLHNFSPARIFLGDAGAIPLGFLAIILGIMGWKDNIWPLWFPCLIFSPFIVDATVTLMKRAFHGEKIWQAHRQHYYQRMVQAGLGHRTTALCWYVLMLLIGFSAGWSVQQDSSTQQGTLLVWGAIYLIVLFLFEWIQKFHNNRG